MYGGLTIRENSIGEYLDILNDIIYDIKCNKNVVNVPDLDVIFENVINQLSEMCSIMSDEDVSNIK